MNKRQRKKWLKNNIEPIRKAFNDLANDLFNSFISDILSCILGKYTVPDNIYEGMIRDIEYQMKGGIIGNPHSLPVYQEVKPGEYIINKEAH